MSILDKLSSSNATYKQDLNKELAKEIVLYANAIEAIEELIANLKGKDQRLAGDCIKVLYEVGEIKPALIAHYADDFIALLSSKNNRLQWGAMIALHYITPFNEEKIYQALSHIIDVANAGSVITNDHCVGILVALCKNEKLKKNCFPILMERLIAAPNNQFPAYAEKAFAVSGEGYASALLKVLNARVEKVEPATKKARVQKVISKLN